MKILAVCGNGLGSSFLIEMNIKKILTELKVEAEVNHTDVSSLSTETADIYIMGKDVALISGTPSTNTIVLDSLIDLNELKNKLTMELSKIKS